MNRKIVIIEDETIIRRELKVLLENALYEVSAFSEFDNIVERIREENPDLVLLDVNLPALSGFDVCTQIRERTDVPVIFLTSRDDPESVKKVLSLKGGDDYITKPYQPPLLLARIAAVLKRAGKPSLKEAAKLSHSGVELDIAGCGLSCGEKHAELTKSEMKILYQLFQCPGKYVSRMDLIEYLWENQIFIDDNTLSVNITRIRTKLEPVGLHDFIGTKRGLGYYI